MKRIGRDSTLHEAAVQAAERLASEWAPAPAVRLRVVAPPVTTTTVNPQVWAAALSLADGDASRIEVRTATDVTVHNRPWRSKKKAGDE